MPERRARLVYKYTSLVSKKVFFSTYSTYCVSEVSINDIAVTTIRISDVICETYIITVNQIRTQVWLSSVLVRAPLICLMKLKHAFDVLNHKTWYLWWVFNFEFDLSTRNSINIVILENSSMLIKTQWNDKLLIFKDR